LIQQTLERRINVLSFIQTRYDNRNHELILGVESLELLDVVMDMRGAKGQGIGQRQITGQGMFEQLDRKPGLVFEN
jgi:hypothetical protein